MRRYIMKIFTLVLVMFLNLLIADNTFTITPLYDKGQSIDRVGINNRSIAFKTSSSSTFEHMFSLSRMKIDDNILKNLRFKQIKTSWKAYSLTFPINDSSNSILNVRHMGSLLLSISRKGTRGIKHTVYGFLKNGIIISGGYNGVLEAYNTNGDKLANFIGHIGSIKTITSYREWMVSGGDDGLINIWKLSELNRGQKRIVPFMSLFYAKNGEWVVWTPEGFYTSSKSGASLLNYKILKYKKEINAKQLFKKFYRPDMLLYKIRNRKYYDHIVSNGINGLLEKSLPPSVKFLNIPTHSKKRDLDIEMKVCDNGSGLKDLMLYLRGIPIAVEEATRALKLKKSHLKQNGNRCYTYTRTISLESGDNELIFTASNLKDIDSSPAVKNIYFDGLNKSSSLYILSIAVDNYDKSELKLNFSVKDAKDVTKKFANISESLFENIYTYELYDKDVTKLNIENIFKKISKLIKPEDVFIFYLAGHGVSDAKDASYYFLPSDIRYDNYKQLLKDAVSGYDFRKYYTYIKAYRSLSLIDTCQSGTFGKFTKKTLIINTAQTRFISTIGRATIMASSKDQVAYEGYKGHGAFTYVLLQALKGEADMNSDGKLSIDELANYITQSLPKLTQNRWGYKQEPQRNLIGSNFIFAKTQ